MASQHLNNEKLTEENYESFIFCYNRKIRERNINLICHQYYLRVLLKWLILSLVIAHRFVQLFCESVKINLCSFSLSTKSWYDDNKSRDNNDNNNKNNDRFLLQRLSVMIQRFTAILFEGSFLLTQTNKTDGHSSDFSIGF